MAVSITWALSASGSAETLIDHGNASNGSYTTTKTIYLRHDGSNAITGCGFYFQQKASGYSGSFSAAADFTEIKAWGDDSTANGHGGVQINMDPDNTGGWNATTWDLSESTKSTSTAFTMNTGTGDSSSNVVTLKETMDGTASGGAMSTDGEIPNGVEVRFLARFLIPIAEDTAGVRQLDQVLKYTFTS